MTKKTLQGFGLAIAVFIILSGITLWSDRAQAPSSTDGAAGNISLTVQGLYTDKPIAITEGETVLQVLHDLNTTDPALQLKTKDYSGLGTLVVGMGSLQNGTEGNYWQYQVSGVLPQVGAGLYALKGGDAVKWFFGTSQE